MGGNQDEIGFSFASDWLIIGAKCLDQSDFVVKKNQRNFGWEIDLLLLNLSILFPGGCLFLTTVELKP